MLKLTFDFDFYDFLGLLNPSENTSVFHNNITHTMFLSCD